MNTGGEAAEQIVRMSLEGFEVAAKITGAGAKNIAILLYSILKEEQKTKLCTASLSLKGRPYEDGSHHTGNKAALPQSH